MKSLIGKICVLLLQIFYVTAYRRTFIEDLCSSTDDISIWNLGSANDNSSGILVASRHRKFLKGMNCTILIQPPLGFGVILSVRHLDFRPYHPPECINYVQISEDDKTSTLCGYSDDISEYKSYATHGKGMEMKFFTGNKSGPEYRSDVTFTVTSYVEVSYNCEMKMFRCDNSRCIWKGLKCDGHNNCGDQSDEFTNRMANCGMMSPGVIAAIVVGSIMAFLLVILLPFVCYRCCSKRRNSRNGDRDPPLIQPPQNYGTATGRVNIQEANLPQEPSSSHRRYQDLPPAYKP